MTTKFKPGSIRIAIVASRFNQFIVDQLIDGARDALSGRGFSKSEETLVWVPGAFELPLAAHRLAESGQFTAIIALGAIVRGGTPHFDYVCSECASGLSRVALDHSIPVLFGVLTTDTIEQALERAGKGEGNKGFDVAMAAVDMIESLQGIDRILAKAET